MRMVTGSANEVLNDTRECTRRGAWEARWKWRWTNQ